MLSGQLLCSGRLAASSKFPPSLLRRWKKEQHAGAASQHVSAEGVHGYMHAH
jgi:hypothetical protein